MRMGLIRNHYVGRTFIQPQQSIRHFGVKVKLNPVRSILEGKRVVLVDDSIVRGTTSRKIVQDGARPPARAKCTCGSAVRRRFRRASTASTRPAGTELIAATHTLEEIREYVDADSLAYLSLEGLTGGGRQRAAARTARRATPASTPWRFRATSRPTCSSRSRLSTDDDAARCPSDPDRGVCSLRVASALADARASAGAAPARDPGRRSPRAGRGGHRQARRSLDLRVRIDAARTVRRAPAARCRAGADQGGRQRTRTATSVSARWSCSPASTIRAPRDVMRAALDQPNDRLRAVAYGYFEHNPDPTLLPTPARGAGTETAEFVRPALTRALAAYGADPKVRETLTGLVMTRAGFLPQRGHRGARRLQGGVRAGAASSRSRR